MMDSIEEILQIKIYHPIAPIFQILVRLLDCRMTASPRSKSVTTRMKRRLVQWLEYLPYCFLDRPIDDVGNS